MSDEPIEKRLCSLEKKVESLQKIVWMGLGAISLVLSAASVYAAFFK